MATVSVHARILVGMAHLGILSVCCALLGAYQGWDAGFGAWGLVILAYGAGCNNAD